MTDRTSDPDSTRVEHREPQLVLGHVRLEERLGEGSSGVVWRARLLEDRNYAAAGARVAVKVVRASGLSEPGAFQRFLREGNLGARIDHPAVVRTYEADALNTAAGFHHFLVMEYVEGRSLRDVLHERGRLPEALVRWLGEQLAGGLAAIHAAGAVHRDVKPGNVILTLDDTVKLMDFGTARIETDSLNLTRSGQFLGTFAYAAPEQFESAREVLPASDQYGLGVVLFEAASGQLPVPGSNVREFFGRRLEQPRPRLRALNSRLSPFLDEVVATLLEVKPKNRFDSAEEIRQALALGEDGPWWRDRRGRATISSSSSRRNLNLPRPTPLVARDGERKLLGELFAAARTGSGTAAIVEGEAGVGKTRLLDEFARDLEDGPDPPRVLFGTYPGHEAVSWLGGFAEAIVGGLGTDGLAERLAERLGPGRESAAALARLLLALEPAPDDTPLGAESVSSLLCHLLRGLAADGPILWIVEDLGTAPAQGRNLFQALARIVADQPVLLIASCRGGLPAAEFENLRRLPHFRHVGLTRLSPRGVIDLLGHALSSTPLAERLGGKIAAKSDGNPRFVLEIVRELAEQGQLEQQSDGSYQAVGRVTEIGIPSSLKSLVLARLNELGNEERALVDVAAVHGAVVEPKLVARVREIRLLRALEAFAEVERRTGVVRATAIGFEFDPPQLRDVVVSAVPPMLRAEYCGLLAAAYEENLGQRPAVGEDAVVLADHLLRAGHDARGLELVEPALEHLARGCRHEAVVDLAERALVASAESDAAREARLHMLRAASFDSLGRHEEQRREAERAVAAALRTTERGLRVEARRRLGRLLHAIGEHMQARPILEDAIAESRADGSADAEAHCMVDLGIVLNSTGLPEAARDTLEKSLALARRCGAGAVELRATGNLGIVLLELGRYIEAERLFETQGELARAADSRLDESRAIGNLGLALVYQGKWTAARRCYGRQIELCRLLAYRPGEVIATGNLGGLEFHLGAMAAAGTLFHHYLELSRDLANHVGMAVGAINVGHVRLQEGAIDTAGDWLRQGLELCVRIGAPREEAEAHHGLGELARVSGRLDEAEAYHERALELRRRVGANDAVARSLVALGRVAIGRDDRSGARAQFVEANRLIGDAHGQDPGPVPRAWLQWLGRGDARVVVVPDEAPAVVRAEAHLVLAGAADSDQQRQARAILEGMSQHLAGDALAAFWRFNPVASIGPLLAHSDPGRG